MTAHLLPGWIWVDCSEPETCMRLVHLNETTALLNSYPHDWVQALADVRFRADNYAVEVLDETGRVHNTEGHAKELLDGSILWYRNGYRYRPDGPSMIHINGSLSWSNEYGSLHRDDGPAVIRANGTQEWHQHDEPHRLDGPALVYADGTQYWYKEGDLHREDGPAVIRPDGTRKWFINGKEVS